MDYFGYGEQDFIPCELCGGKAVDIHHIYGRGKGKDRIENLMALCRYHHTMAHDEAYSKSSLETMHEWYLKITNK